jgi:hypothetical protein
MQLCAPNLRTSVPMHPLCERVECFLPELVVFVAMPELAPRVEQLYFKVYSRLGVSNMEAEERSSMTTDQTPAPLLTALSEEQRALAMPKSLSKASSSRPSSMFPGFTSR